MNQYQRATILFLVCAFVTGCMAGALVVYIWQTSKPPELPAVQVVQVPAVTVQIVERVITATPAPTEGSKEGQLEVSEGSQVPPAPTATPQPTATVPLVDLAEVKIVSIKPDSPSMLYPVVFELEITNLGDMFWNGAYSVVATGLAVDPDEGIIYPCSANLPGVVEPGQTVTVSVSCNPKKPQQEMDLQWLVLNDRNQFLQTGALPVGAGEDAIPVAPPNMTLRIMSVKPTPPSGRKLKLLVEGVLGKGWEACPPGG